jgi:hypothetical protein
MRGRVRLPADYSEIKIRLRFDATAPTPNLATCWNTPPTGDMLGKVYSERQANLGEHEPIPPLMPRLHGRVGCGTADERTARDHGALLGEGFTADNIIEEGRRLRGRFGSQ